jgi:Rhodopirellula transposase DDE domain
MNWRGRPLTSHEVIVETIGATTTRTGLSVHAELDQACGVQKLGSGCWPAGSRCLSCSVFILIDEAVEDFSASDRADSEVGWQWLARLWWATVQCPVRSMLVVVREVFIEHQSQVAFAIDQQPIGALAAQCADPALADRVCPWCLDRGLDDLDAFCFEIASKLAAYLASRSRIRNRNEVCRSVSRLRACWVTHGPVGC